MASDFLMFGFLLMYCNQLGLDIEIEDIDVEKCGRADNDCILRLQQGTSLNIQGTNRSTSWA